MSNQADIQKDLTLSSTLSFLSLFAWIIPIIGVPVSIAGIITSSRAWDRFHKPMSVFWFMLSVAALVASGVNAYVGARNGYKWGKLLQSQLESGESDTAGTKSHELQQGCLNQADAKYIKAWNASDADGDGKLSALDGSIRITTDLYSDQIDCYLDYPTPGSQARIDELRIKRQQELDRLNAILDALGNASR